MRGLIGLEGPMGMERSYEQQVLAPEKHDNPCGWLNIARKRNGNNLGLQMKEEETTPEEFQ